MAARLPNGSIIAMASGYGDAKDMTVLTNASPGVATLEAGHDVVEGDIIEVTSGWTRLTGRIVRAGTVATNDVDLEGINTTSTVAYPAGSGVGTIREISGWTTIAQILGVTTDGGGQQFTNFQFLESDAQSRLPTVRDAAGATLQIADDPSLAGYLLLEAASDDRDPRAVRVTLPNGNLIFYNAYVSLNKTPTLTVNEVMSLTATLSFVNENPVRYTA
jgi:hypothetical protein